MSQKTEIAKRMKSYEAAYSYNLPIRTPCIIRLDGRAFKNFTKGFKLPFDNLLKYCMIEAAKKLCQNIQNTQLAYTQSDEITLLLVERGENSQNWFDKNIVKMTSISASMCTNGFNEALYTALMSGFFVNPFTNEIEYLTSNEYIDKIGQKLFKAEFDSRAFCLPEFEVVNEFIFRQRDAIRNSIQQVAYNVFSNKEVQNVKTNELIEKLKNEKNIDYYKYPACYQRGVCVYKETLKLENDAVRTRWTVDANIPRFEEEKTYINKYLIYQGDLKQNNWKKSK